ncbi:CHAP domain-containing protein [Nocardiopsis dassonvillei]|uniref:CHAP domain-containing protein n=1 Tax=Nocardiopsis dassonvillei TaxID=2014 RepID=UPI00157C6A3D|nr:CHAP domain-containing protein [Nocardiopsis dassonvillei]
MTANSMLAEARRWLGTRGRPNTITRAYSERNGNAFLNAPWCNMAVTEWARATGNFNAVCFGTDYAYTVWHAQRFQQEGRWYWGTTSAKPGDIVFFDWNGARSIGAIDHVGIVEKNLGGGRLQTIEGNTGDACLRRVRSGSIIVGVGRPAYGASSGGSANTEEGSPLLGLKIGDKGPAVKAVQLLAKNAGFGDVVGKIDSEYGPKLAEAVRLSRKYVGSKALKGYGDEITPDAYEQLHRAHAKRQAEDLIASLKLGSGGGSLPATVRVVGELEVQR